MFSQAASFAELLHERYFKFAANTLCPSRETRITAEIDIMGLNYLLYKKIRCLSPVPHQN